MSSEHWAKQEYGIDLDPELCKNLEATGIYSFFPIQHITIPKILATGYTKDLCINAPTGSGKTMVYCLPIVQRLVNRVFRRLRAVVIVPSRDLVVQVKKVLDGLVVNTPLTVGVAMGQSNFTSEQRLLTDAKGNSLVDILVATPGRLVDHLEQSPGFTLQHVQFVVVDEADRLLNQSYQDWITKLYNSIYVNESSIENLNKEDSLHPATIRHADGKNPHRIRVPLIRILLSATLTRNPRKLAAIGMPHAELITVNEELNVSSDAKVNLFSTPENLEEGMIECEATEKPLILLELLHKFDGQLTIIFTSSINATHRLCRLLQLHSSNPDSVREYSSTLNQKQRSQLVQACHKGQIKVVVCSDAMARGMDIAHVENVVNYDVPPYIKTYIHRVGRTARAGRAGRAITLVKKGQVKGLVRMLSKANKPDGLPTYPVDTEHMQTLVPRYTECLASLKEILAKEKAGQFGLTTSISLKRKTRDDEEKNEEEDESTDPKELLRQKLIAHMKRRC
ncbi:DEAD/DEAH box RNA helicase [Thraustotheca clavata]|uniref:ATP-dependent RNA helicase n=1 Tax=Thraustotheca clavata TaxID=74557 RepID=A0A1W0A2K1_9STRA|nr:DEAD/DEAH box RNA helicase [Thraustotheca clavata]